jgi:23S rRNA (cytidine2498-2'-O)-methyltransferase
VREQLLQEAPADLFVAEAKQPRVGDLVLDVIVAQGEPMAVGAHRHHSGHLPYPGGRIPLTLPPEAPSRAWLKIEEALGWSALPLRAGETAVEIGSAPGGASWALLQRGLTVIGVDPGAMDSRVLAQPRFTHLQTTLGDVRREQLPARVDWLLLDVNLAPQVALHGIRRIVSTLRGTLRGVVFTLKLNDWDMAAELPALCERIQGMGLHSLKVRQLVANRREVCVVAYAQPQAKSLPGLSHSQAHSQP